jgi:hypothetical protein
MALTFLLTLAMVVGLMPGMSLTALADDGVAYQAATVDGETHKVTFSTQTCSIYTTVAANTTNWTNDTWYVVNSDITIEKRITVSGTVNLILCDGAKLTASEGITVANDNSLTIYGQTAGSGELIARSDYVYAAIGGDGTYDNDHDYNLLSNQAGTIVINGGKVTATDTDNGAGIGNYSSAESAGTLIVNGGTVTATGREKGAGIGGGENSAGMAVTINGGTVTANGGNYGAGIGGGKGGIGGSVTIYGGTVTATGGLYAGAGIGGGSYGVTGCTVAIHGGQVTAHSQSQSWCAGIDCRKTSLTVTGGTVKATGADSDPECAGIVGSISLDGMYLYGSDTTENPEDDLSNYVPLTEGDYARTKYMTVNNVTPHTHSFNYSASGATITATCTADGCTLTDKKATLTIGAPTSGSDATVTVSPEGAITGYAVKYQTKSGGTWGAETDTAPSTAGIHKASITLTGTDSQSATASVTYGNNCITYATGLTHGSISGDKGATCGATIKPTITPETGYELDALTVTPEKGSGVEPSKIKIDGGTFVMPEANVTVSATFKKINSAITLTQPAEGGTLTAKKGSTDVTTADYGDTITLGNSPAAGYKFTSYSVTKTGESSTVVTVTNGAFTMPAYPVTVTGTFTPIDYTVTVSESTNGTVSASKTADAHVGDEITLTINSDAGYQLDTLTVKDASGTDVTVTNNKFTMPASNVTVSATFKEINYTVTVDGSIATVKDDTPAQNTYTAELKVPSDKIYDGSAVDLSTATVEKSTGFPDKVTVGAISFKDQDGKPVTTAKHVGIYTATANVGDKTISKSFEIKGLEPIDYAVVSKSGNKLIITIRTLTEYIKAVNTDHTVWLDNGDFYVVKGNVTLNRGLVYTGKVSIILCDGATLTIRGGIWHYGSELTIYGQRGQSGKIVVQGDKTVTLDNVPSGASVDQSGALGGDIFINGGKLTVIADKNNNQKVACEDGNTTVSFLSNVSLTCTTSGGEKVTLTEGTYGPAELNRFTAFVTKESATVKTKPTAKSLTENGSAQQLVTAGEAENGTMQYALGKDATTVPTSGWGEAIPTGTNAGTYYVWYKVIGDENHSDTEPACVTVTINDPAATPAAAAAVTSITVNTKTVNAKKLNAAVAKAGGSNEYVTTIVLGKKVKKISKSTFKNYPNAKTLVVKTKKLKRASVKKSLKGSKITNVKVKVSSKKKINKKYVRKYKKIFTKKNAGKKVKVSR